MLAKNIFYVPPFQRAYAWTKNEIERYFSDVMRIVTSELDSTQSDKLEHFFGTIVLKEEKEGFDSKYIIVDGQQRLTTTLLFLIALRDLEVDITIRKKITDTFLKSPNSPFTDKIKLKQVTKDWEAYKALINESEPPKGIINSAYQLFKQLITRQRDTLSLSTNQYIVALSKMNVAVIFLDERPHKGEDPQVIFETLNSLGKPLSLADLVRNYILLKLPSFHQTNTYENVWYPKVESVLLDNTSKFIRDYLQYKLNKPIKVVNDANTKEIYQVFKDFVNNKSIFNNYNEFIEDITRYPQWYKWITNEYITETISSNSTKDKEIKELLRNIFHDIKSEAFKPFVLGLLEYHQTGKNGLYLGDEKFVETLQYIRTYLIRRRILGLAQGENREIVSLCKNVESLVKGNVSILDLLSKMFYALRMPNDVEVREYLEDADFYKESTRYVKFVLGKIEEYNSKVSVNFRDPKITIEHIMPKECTPEWKDELGPGYGRIHSELLHNIGNLILTEFNSEMGAKPFKEKQEKLKKSNLSFRQFILSVQKWDEDTILAHRDLMIQNFLNTFSLPEEYKNKNNWNEYSYDLTTDIISPTEQEIDIIVEHRKPRLLIIDDTLRYEVKTWKEVMIKFIRYIYKHHDFNTILDKQNQNYIFGRECGIITGIELKEKYEREPTVAKRDYRSIDNEEVTKNNIKDNQYYIHTLMSAPTCMTRLSRMMEIFNMPDESVKIHLKPLKEKR
ncbi:MAG: DUF262 domain-containing HNH endonuclease family protein [Bacteroidia bacterium]|nr:DUF262 domain-containing HNH endonuclease family protein [Bacteroidia bacterium]